MSKSKNCLIATEIGLLNNGASIAAIKSEGGIYHAGQIKNNMLIIDGDEKITLESLEDEKIHFIHVGKQPAEIISLLTKDGKFNGLIVGPEGVPVDADVEYIGRIGIGVNNIPIEQKQELGHKFVATNTPGSNSVGTTYHTIRSILELTDVTLVGKKFTIVGAGNIGSLTANAVKMLGADVTIWNRSEVKTEDRIEGIKYICGDKKQKPEALQSALKGAEYVSLHVPETPDTVSFIGADEIRLMADGVKIINLARPAVLSPEAAYEGIKIKKIGGLVVDGDYFKDKESALSPFVKIANDFPENKNIIMVPHIGGDTSQGDREQGFKTQHEQYLDFAKHKKVSNLKSAEKFMPERCESTGITQKNNPKSAEAKILNLCEEAQAEVTKFFKIAINHDVYPLREVSNKTVSGQLYTATDEFKKLYCNDLRGQEIFLPDTKSGDVIEAFAQIISCMGGTVKEKGKQVSNDNLEGPFASKFGKSNSGISI